MPSATPVFTRNHLPQINSSRSDPNAYNIFRWRGPTGMTSCIAGRIIDKIRASNHATMRVISTVHTQVRPERFSA